VTRREAQLAAEIQDLLRQLNALVRRRDVLRQLGTDERELNYLRTEIGNLHWRLALRVREQADRDDATAA
jgi:hypothetical protein